MSNITALIDRLRKPVALLLAGTVLLLLATSAAAYDNSNDPFNRTGLDPQQLRGAYLTRAANCMGCHTARGGKPFAGGLSSLGRLELAGHTRQR